MIAIDGKHLRGAARRGKQVHLVSAWDSNRSLLLGQVKAHEKSNEITAIPELLDSLDFTKAIVTIDAAGCQTDIVTKIRDGGGDKLFGMILGLRNCCQEYSRLICKEILIKKPWIFRVLPRTACINI